jgi:N-ethylmaleimide reductase
VKRVQDKGGKIFLQLWHMGRQGHSSFNSKKELVSASAIGLPQGQTKNVNGEAVSRFNP